MKYEQLPGWVPPATSLAVPAIYAAQKLLRGGKPTPLGLAASLAFGYAIPRAWNDVVAKHKDDVDEKAFEREMNSRALPESIAAMTKQSNMLTGIGGGVLKGLRYVGQTVADIGRAIVTKPKANAGLGEKLLRPMALTGLGIGAYQAGKGIVNSAKPLNYGDYEKNLVNYGRISPDQMSASARNNMIKSSSIKYGMEKAAIVGTAMNVMMGGFAISSGVDAMKKAKTPVMGSAIQQSAVYGNNNATRMNNFT